MRRSMGEANFARACDLLNSFVDELLNLGGGSEDEGTGSPERPRDRVEGFTEKQRRVGFTGDRAPSRGGGLAEMFGDCPAPLRL